MSIKKESFDSFENYKKIFFPKRSKKREEGVADPRSVAMEITRRSMIKFDAEALKKFR